MLTVALLLLLQAGALYETDSRFGHIQVRDVAGRRELLFDTITQSAATPGAPKQLLLDYTQASMVGLCFSAPKRVLIIGLGGASMPNFLHAFYPQAQIDSVEIDAKVVEVAKAYFDFHESPTMRVFVEDGAVYMAKTKQNYDLIFLDAYAPDFIPPALATRSFFEQVRVHLAEEGALVSNVWGPPAPGYQAMITQQRAVFGDLYIVKARTSGNHIFVATPTKRSVKKVDLLACAEKFQHFPFDLRGIVQSGFSLDEQSQAAHHNANP